MRRVAVIVLGSVEYVLTLFVASCCFIALFRWAYRPDGFGFDTTLVVIVGGLLLNLILLATCYSFRFFSRRSLHVRIMGSFGLAIASTALTVPAINVIERIFALPSQHVPGSWDHASRQAIERFLENAEIEKHLDSAQVIYFNISAFGKLWLLSVAGFQHFDIRYASCISVGVVTPSPKKWRGVLLAIWCAALCGLSTAEAREDSHNSDAKEDESEVLERAERGRMIRRAIEESNVPINFWGKVTDQDGVPLEGVKVTYTCAIMHGNENGVSWTPKEQKGQAVSDATGSFAITGLKGHSLGLDSFSKPGYEHRQRLNDSYGFGGFTPEPRFVPQRDKPVCFAMVNERTLEPLVHLEGRLRVTANGPPERWSLWEEEPEPEDGPDPNGELAISFRTEPAVASNPAQGLNWSADIEIVGGELMEASWAEAIHRAPETGYSATLPYSREPEKLGTPRCAYYVRTRNGNYGRITVDISTSHDGRTASFFIKSEMNPRPGSRNLESVEGD